MASKEDRRIRRRVNSNEPISEDSTNSATAMNHTSSNGVISKDSSTINGSQNDENNKGFKNGKSNGNGDSEESITAATSSTVSLRNESNVKLLNLSGHQGEVFMCVWNPSQTQLASGSADGMCRLWDLEQMDGDKWGLPESSNIKLRTCVMPHANVIGERFKDITSITWSPDGQYIATGCYTGEARIWDSKGALKMILKEHTGPVFSLKWNKQGNYLLSGSYDRRTVIWSPETGQIVKSFLLHTQPVLDVDWRDSDTFASCSSDMVIHVCKVSSPDTIPATTMLGHLDEVNAVSWSPGGHYLASCSDDTTAKIWSVEFGLLFNLRAHNKEIFTLRWTQTGPSSPHPTAPLLLCTASFDGTVKVWDGMKGNLMYSLGKHTQPVYSVSPSPSSFVVATGSLGGHVSVWSLLDGSLVSLFLSLLYLILGFVISITFLLITDSLLFI